VLDAKRSNVINIGLTVLPPPNTIKAAILKMDSAIMNREGIEVRPFYLRSSMFQRLGQAAVVCDVFSVTLPAEKY